LTPLDGTLPAVPDAHGRMGFTVTLLPDNDDTAVGAVFRVESWFRLAVTTTQTPELPDVGTKTFIIRYRTDGGGRSAPRRFLPVTRFGTLTCTRAPPSVSSNV
jgi:hypothetical protein